MKLSLNIKLDDMGNSWPLLTERCPVIGEIIYWPHNGGRYLVTEILSTLGVTSTGLSYTLTDTIIMCTRIPEQQRPPARCSGLYDDGIADGNLTRCSTTGGCALPGCPFEERARR